jgi:hypothetical protein
MYRFHYNIQVSLVEKILLDLNDVGVIQIFKVFNFFDGVYFVFFLDRDNFADSFDFTNPMNDFANETGGTAIYDSGKVIEIENLPNIIFNELSVGHSEIIGGGLGSG